MCNDWIKEFKEWCKSFTRTEILLAILECFLLIICIGFLIFLILHLLVCSYKQHGMNSTSPNFPGPKYNEDLAGDDEDTTPSSKLHKTTIINKVETRTQKVVFIYKGESYTGAATVPYGTGTEKIIFVNKGVPFEGIVMLPYNITSTTPYTPGHGDDERLINFNDSYIPDNRTDKNRYASFVTIPHSIGTKIIFINKEIPNESVVKLPYDVTAKNGTFEYVSDIPQKKVFDNNTASTGALYDGVSHKKIYINKEITSESVQYSDKEVTVTEVRTLSLDGVSHKKIIINKETIAQDGQKPRGGELTDGGLPQASREPQQSPTYTMSDLECSWHPSKKTVAPTHYYFEKFMKRKNIIKEAVKLVLKTDGTDYSTMDYANLDTSEEKGSPNEKYHDLRKDSELADLDTLAYDDQSDGEESVPLYKSFVLALVKVKPSKDSQFGCILTAVTAHWTLTAASCIESIEEVDSLDAFVMLEGYGEEEPGRSYGVSDVRVHPMFQGASRSHDLAALRSEQRLRRVQLAARLPTLVDYYSITAAERFTILGFGSFR